MASQLVDTQHHSNASLVCRVYSHAGAEQFRACSCHRGSSTACHGAPAHPETRNGWLGTAGHCTKWQPSCHPSDPKRQPAQGPLHSPAWHNGRGRVQRQSAQVATARPQPGFCFPGGSSQPARVNARAGVGGRSGQPALTCVVHACPGSSAALACPALRCWLKSAQACNAIGQPST